MRARILGWLVGAVVLALFTPVVAQADDDSPADHRLRRFRKPAAERPAPLPEVLQAAESAREIQNVRDRREPEAPAAVNSADASRPPREREMAERSATESRGSKIASKFGRGIINILTGWVEFPIQIVKRTKEDGLGAGLSLGLLEGIGMTVVRTGAGAVDVITFLVPLPGDYDPLLEPPTVFH